MNALFIYFACVCFSSKRSKDKEEKAQSAHGDRETRGGDGGRSDHQDVDEMEPRADRRKASDRVGLHAMDAGDAGPLSTHSTLERRKASDCVGLHAMDAGDAGPLSTRSTLERRKASDRVGLHDMDAGDAGPLSTRSTLEAESSHSLFKAENGHVEMFETQSDGLVSCRTVEVLEHTVVNEGLEHSVVSFASTVMLPEVKVLNGGVDQATGSDAVEV